MKTPIITFILIAGSFFGFAQSIVGNWQLETHRNCDGDTISGPALNEPKRGTPPVLQFKDSQNGEESSRMLNDSKASNAKNFLYKIDGTTLYVLDKRSQIIVGSFTIDTLQPDTLSLSNVAHPCDTRVFKRIK